MIVKTKKFENGHNELKLFKITNKQNIYGINLLPGKYILKDIRKEEISDKDINMLKSLSDLKLIPKIYFINNIKIIMDYFDGITLQDYLKKHKLSEKLYQKIRKLVFKWHRLGYAHGDINLFEKNKKYLGMSNILISKKESIILIDPSLGKIYNTNKKLSQFNLKKKWDLEFLEKLKTVMREDL